MAGVVVASNGFLSEYATVLRSDLNVNHWLQLFQNDLDPSPADAIASFIPCSFPGYAPKSLDAKFSGPLKVIDGEWAIGSPVFAFTCTAPSNQIAFGWYITTGALLKFSNRFLAPVPLGTGVQVLFRIEVQNWALVTV